MTGALHNLPGSRLMVSKIYGKRRKVQVRRKLKDIILYRVFSISGSSVEDCNRLPLNFLSSIEIGNIRFRTHTFSESGYSRIYGMVTRLNPLGNV